MKVSQLELVYYSTLYNRVYSIHGQKCVYFLLKKKCYCIAINSCYYQKSVTSKNKKQWGIVCGLVIFYRKGKPYI